MGQKLTGTVRYKREYRNENEEWYVYMDDRLAGSVALDPIHGDWKPGVGDLRLDPRATRDEAADALISWRRRKGERRSRRSRQRREEARP
jgi:hypothetical protein